ncbi:hypothetical protein OHS33_38640 (plasmid) [Streptomyces sp. NBC_00536]|uniref:hypothetical protein n=1 Tax=Streptomyces sp. NBC_00536 TaxID=2975769 RepID=UPI002E80C4F3|nr:hypothetical protein [Streptomyces sp. NBC_00536]WUC84421.1 hypothetical protein OHS33_38640 [Streptomyces sp. NBC_00536]
MSTSTLLAEHELMRDPIFGARVRAAFCRLARDVLAEDASTPGNPLRVSLARQVLNPGGWDTPGLAPVIATDPQVSAAAAAATGAPEAAQSAVTDAQILDAVRRAWNVTAGVPAALQALPSP